MLNINRVFFSAAFLLSLALLIGGCDDGATVTRMAPGDAPDIEAFALIYFRLPNLIYGISKGTCYAPPPGSVDSRLSSAGIVIHQVL